MYVGTTLNQQSSTFQSHVKSFELSQRTFVESSDNYTGIYVPLFL